MSVVLDRYPETSTTKDNTNKRRTGKSISLRTEFEPDILFQGKKDVSLSKTVNKQLVINVTSTEL